MRCCRSPLILFALLAAGISLTVCAAACFAGEADPRVADQAGDDPYEDTNRAIFHFNQDVNHAVLIPVGKAYRNALPEPVRQSVHDFLQNLNGPDVFANDVMQAQGTLATNTALRLLINTTVGIGGLFDPAGRIGIPYHANDFGITLATWGFRTGPYLMIPILGPSNERDLSGYVVDSFADPGDEVAWNRGYWWATIARSTTAGVDELSRNIQGLEDLEKTSLDFYATIRSLYAQRRAAQVRHELSNLPNPAPVSGSGD
jgi:phospholipid-binding lipoprotein MlaA